MAWTVNDKEYWFKQNSMYRNSKFITPNNERNPNIKKNMQRDKTYAMEY
jgi:hypothetical protein